jgi:hypothetical protein
MCTVVQWARKKLSQFSNEEFMSSGFLRVVYRWDMYEAAKALGSVPFSCGAGDDWKDLLPEAQSLARSSLIAGQTTRCTSSRAASTYSGHAPDFSSVTGNEKAPSIPSPSPLTRDCFNHHHCYSTPIPTHLSQIHSDIQVYAIYIYSCAPSRFSTPSALNDSTSSNPSKRDSSRPSKPSVVDSELIHDSIQHRLLKYNLATATLVENLLWAATLVFCNCTIFAMPDRGPTDRVLDMLNSGLAKLDRVEGPSTGVKMWMEVVGVMGCRVDDGSRREILLRRLRRDAEIAGIKDWNDLKDMFRQVLWVDEACDEGGRMVWDMIQI